ncbi:hypothetical protein E2C01_062484 [Portunus trituberculatus]|uniref:Uncharacterized protein n=1 Tax=Portunus trituberculatus TaxID=210409 RepID=A0A5B7HE65_PORTR|nr:hypothetical protein [Portunus trituberculatus]
MSKTVMSVSHPPSRQRCHEVDTGAGWSARGAQHWRMAMTGAAKWVTEFLRKWEDTASSLKSQGLPRVD